MTLTIQLNADDEIGIRKSGSISQNYPTDYNKKQRCKDICHETKYCGLVNKL